METVREVLRGSLGRSLRDLRDEDRMAAAWTVACGRAMGAHGLVVGYEGGTVRVEVTDATWLKQMVSLRGALERDLARIAELPVVGIHFELKRPSESVRQQVSEPVRQRSGRTTRGKDR